MSVCRQRSTTPSGIDSSATSRRRSRTSRSPAAPWPCAPGMSDRASNERSSRDDPDAERDIPSPPDVIMLIAGVDLVVVERAKCPTPTEGPDALVETIVDMITSFDADVIGVGIGIPGPVHEGQVVSVPNLEDWSEPVDVAGLVSDRLNVPVALGNDANLGLLGEWVNGVAQGRSNVLGVWIGTGIGAGLILDGRPYVGSVGGAGEFGHMIIRADGALCSCGRRGCVEAYAGRRRMVDTIKQMINAGRTT